MGTTIDPLIESAFRRLGAARAALHRRLGAPARETPPAPEALVESVADALQAESLPRDAWLDVGVWGRPLYRSAARRALWLQAVSLTGDELG
jgi:hypothetical protein